MAIILAKNDRINVFIGFFSFCCAKADKQKEL